MRKIVIFIHLICLCVKITSMEQANSDNHQKKLIIVNLTENYNQPKCGQIERCFNFSGLFPELQKEVLVHFIKDLVNEGSGRSQFKQLENDINLLLTSSKSINELLKNILLTIKETIRHGTFFNPELDYKFALLFNRSAIIRNQEKIKNKIEKLKKSHLSITAFTPSIKLAFRIKSLERRKEFLETYIDAMHHTESRQIDDGGCTALMLAARYGRLSLVNTLIKKGANVNAENISGFSVLLIAVRNDQVEVLQKLIENHADINKFCGDNAIGFILQSMSINIYTDFDTDRYTEDQFNKRIKLLEMLLNAGAIIKKRNLKQAKETASKEIIELIEKYYLIQNPHSNI